MDQKELTNQVSGKFSILLSVSLLILTFLVNNNSLYSQVNSTKGDAALPDAVEVQREMKKIYLPKTSTTQTVEVKWQGSDLAATYSVEVYNTWNKLIFEGSVLEPKIVMNLNPGKYVIRVAAVSRFNVKGEWSDKSELVVKEKGVLDQAEIKERVDMLNKVTRKIEKSTSSSSLDALGIGASDILGVGVEYSIPKTEISSFNSFIGGIIFFRYHKLFLDNLMPEVRMGYMSGSSDSSAIDSLAILKLYASIAYSIPLFNGYVYIVPMIGGGMNMFSITSQFVGKNYFIPGLAGSLEISVQPIRTMRIFIRGEFMYLPTDNIQFISPAAGLMIKF